MAPAVVLVKCITPLTMGYAVPEAGLERDLQPRKSATPPKTSGYGLIRPFHDGTHRLSDQPNHSPATTLTTEDASAVEHHSHAIVNRPHQYLQLALDSDPGYARHAVSTGHGRASVSDPAPSALIT